MSWSPEARQPGGQPEVQFNGMAIASMVVGILGLYASLPLIGIPSIVALTLGLISYGQIRSSRGSQRGRGDAIAGIVLGGGMLVLEVLVIAILGMAYGA